MNEEFIAKRISQLRKSKGVSATSMSIAVGKNENYINEIEVGKALPSIPALFSICNYFSITIKDFFDENFSKSPDLLKFIENAEKLNQKQFESLDLIIKDLIK